MRLINKPWFGWVCCALLTALTGVVLILYAPGRILQHFSYDLPYALRRPVAVTNVVVVYFDLNSLKLLNQPSWPPDRNIYADLVKRLKDAGARMILFDIVFRVPKPEADGPFGDAIRDHGNVVLGGLFDLTRQQSVESVGLVMGQASPPVLTLRTNARAWGLLALRPLDYSFAARRIFCGINDIDSLAWAAARLDDAKITRQSQANKREFWLNFYGPARSLSSVSLSQALDPLGVPPNLFRGAAVFVGPDPSLSPQTGELDTFPTPYSRLRSGSDSTYMPGVEMHATAYCNLVRGEWLDQMPTSQQALIAVVWAVALCFVLSLANPRRAIVIALGAGLFLSVVSVCLQIYQNLWWTWLVPAVVQPGLALGLSMAYRYSIESRQRQHMRDAFAAYVTPEVAEQIISRGLDLAPGGSECLVSIMFTDIQSFTDLSEKVTPKELSLILTNYFDEATNCVLAQQGTVLKYIGDSVMAIWGAPIPWEDHAIRAVNAALSINKIGTKFFYGHRLVTRIGINTGTALVGNLGSKFRFDYTVIGASVNYAARLEKLNKLLKTTFLISDSTRQALTDAFHARRLGQFILRGTGGALLVHEVLAHHDQVVPRPQWCATFESGLDAFQRCDLDAAEQLFRQVIQERADADGPAQFYLNQIELARRQTLEIKKWTGTIAMLEK